MRDRVSIASKILKRVWGYDGFSKDQLAIVGHILESRDVLALLATGGGKSICFQVPALMSRGLTLVISPLIALMQDQVENLRIRGIEAHMLNSSLEPEHRDAIYSSISDGTTRLLYVSPEGLRSGRLRTVLANRGVTLCALDEAHCVTSWGRDFRPSYREIGAILGKIEALQGRRIQRIAFTATATQGSQDEIKSVFGMQDAPTHVGSLRRENLIYSRRLIAGKNYTGTLLSVLHGAPPGKKVVYGQSKDSLDKLSEELQSVGVGCEVYHAGRSYADRQSALSRFMAGEVDIVLATDAFGMGVDCPDIRMVVHLGLPMTIEEYVQQSGRAGRDGRAASCILIQRGFDALIHQTKTDNSCPDPRQLDAFFLALEQHPDDIPVRVGALGQAIPSLKDIAPMSDWYILLSQLQAQGLLERVWSPKKGEVLQIPNRGKLPNCELLEARNSRLQEKAAAMREYASTRTVCLPQYIERYFGGDSAVMPRCGECGVCKGEAEEFDRRMALIIRTIREARRRYGVRVIAEILIGGRGNWSVRKMGLDRLSTFGALPNENARELRRLILGMIASGYIARHGNNIKAGLQDTAIGHRAYLEYINENKGLCLRRGSAEPGPSLRAALTECRVSIARGYQCAPSDVITDEAMENILRVRPNSYEELTNTPGVGPAKAALYGDSLLKVLVSYAR